MDILPIVHANYSEHDMNIYERIRQRTKPETIEKVQKEMNKLLEIDRIIDEAYSLYMPQIRYEITELTKFLVEIKGDDPWNILEIGTKYGGTLLIDNRINPNGMNISIDMSDGGIHGGVSEEEMDKRDLWFNERFSNCHLIRGDSHNEETKLKVIDLLGLKYASENVWGTNNQEYFIFGTPKIDFLFIDGDHSYEGVEQDFEMYAPFVKKGGIICFHDIVISEKHHERNVYVGEFWKELTRNRMPYEPNVCEINGNEYEVIEFVEDKNQTWAGIGALVKL